MEKRLLAVLAAVLGIALIAAGCGGSSNEEGTTTASLTKAEFVKKGNEICKRGSAEIEEAFEKFAKENHLSKSKQPSKAEIEKVSESIIVPNIRSQVEGIKALGVPKEDATGAEEVIASAEKSLERVEADPTLITEEGSSKDPFTETNKLAKAYGLTACAEEGEEGKEGKEG